MSRFLHILFFVSAIPVWSVAATLSSGPMVGYSEMREVPVWVQTDSSAEVRLHYWPKDKSGKRKTSDVFKTSESTGFAVTLIAGGLTPGTRYEYAIELDSKIVELPYATEFETIPFFQGRTPPPDFKLALGGANYVNDPDFDPLNRKPGGDYLIYLAIAAKKPNLMIWTGNTIHLRESDWNSYSGYVSRYTKSRTVPELQPLLANIHHSAIWSSNDYGRPGADRHTWNKETAQKAFETFWPNPSHGVADIPGTATVLRWSDVDFFLLDDRTHRDLSNRLESKRTILGDAQRIWLIEMLKRSQATFKVIVAGSPILNPAKSDENLTAAPKERKALLDALKDNKLGRVFIISGGKDHGELTKMVRAGAPDIYELTMGPMTARPAKDTRELNYFRVPGTSTFQRHFSTLEFHGPENARKVSINVFDATGTELWNETFTASQLDFGK